MENAHWWGLHWFWIVPFLFMFLIFVFAAPVFRRVCSGRGGFGRRTGWTAFGCCHHRRGPTEYSWHETPRQILDQRYASGEITKEQYEQMKHDIESNPSQPTDYS